MNADVIAQLARYLDRTLGSRPWPFRHPGAIGLDDRIARCLAEPAFGASFVQAIHRLGVPLPDWLHEDSIRHAYEFIHYGIPRPAVIEAYQIAHPARQNLAGILDAMLISTATPLDRVAELLGRSPEVLCYYGDLFFNVRDRSDDPVWLAGLVYPGTRLAYLDAATPDPRQTLLRVGFQHGAEAVARLAGLQSDEAASSGREAVEAFEYSLLERATLLARHGQVDPALLLRQATTVVSRRKLDPTPDHQEPVGMTNLGDCILADLHAISQNASTPSRQDPPEQ